jgi:hypothetical protein
MVFMNPLRAWLDGERGRGIELARNENVTSGAVWQWANDKVPAERVFRVSKFTGISVKNLRPDMMSAQTNGIK